MEITERQLLDVLDIDCKFTVAKVTEKAVMVETSDGKWSGDGYVPLWIPKSIIHHHGFNDSKDNSQHGIHAVRLPEWFINQNRKKLLR